MQKVKHGKKTCGFYRCHGDLCRNKSLGDLISSDVHTSIFDYAVSLNDNNEFLIVSRYTKEKLEFKDEIDVKDYFLKIKKDEKCNNNTLKMIKMAMKKALNNKSKRNIKNIFPSNEKSILSKENPELWNKIKRKDNDGEEIVLSKNELKSVLEKGKYVLFGCGTHPKIKEPKHIEIKRFEKLKKELIKHGYTFVVTEGKYAGPEESTIMILANDMSPEDGYKLGQILNQESIIVSNNGKHLMLSTVSETPFSYVTSDVEYLSSEASDYYTSIKTSDGGFIKFRYKFDMDSPIQTEDTISYINNFNKGD